MDRDGTTPFHRCLYCLAPSSQTLQPRQALRIPRPAPRLHLLSSPPHPQPEAICCLRAPQPVEHPFWGGSDATPAPQHSSWTWGLAGTVTSRDTSAEHRGSEGRDSRGGKSQPQGGTLHTLWDI